MTDADKQNEESVKANSNIDLELQEMRRALIAQEHRIVPAVARLVSTFTDPEKTSHRSAAVSALAWCLLPSAGIAAGGGALIISLITAALTVQQVRILTEQNERLGVQNALAEAQRRSARLGDLGPILNQIESDRNQLLRASNNHQAPPCSDNREYNCWIEAKKLVPISPSDWTPHIYTRSHLYVPSIEVLGKIAALTGWLRPYRTLVDEPEDRECITSARPQNSERVAQTLEEIRRSTANLDFLSRLRQSAEVVYRPAEQASQSALQYLFAEAERGARNMINWSVSSINVSVDTRQGLACSPRSEERGQVLTALYAAGIDIQSVVRAGADFSYADLKKARLRGIILYGVNLEFAILRDADLAASALIFNRFKGADLRGVALDASVVSENNFEEATIAIPNEDDWKSSKAFPPPDLLSGPVVRANRHVGLIMKGETTDPNDLERLCTRVRRDSLSAKRHVAYKDVALAEVKETGHAWALTVLIFDLNQIARNAQPLQTQRFWSGQSGGKLVHLIYLAPECTQR